MAELDSSKRKADAELADAGLSDGHHTARVTELTRLANTLAIELDELETRWLDAQSQLEQAHAL